jgi:hypothetical protein
MATDDWIAHRVTVPPGADPPVRGETRTDHRRSHGCEAPTGGGVIGVSAHLQGGCNHMRPIAFISWLIAAAACTAAPALAAPVPAGQYALQSTGGTVRIGTSTPFELALPAGPVASVSVTGTGPETFTGSALMPAPATVAVHVGRHRPGAR